MCIVLAMENFRDLISAYGTGPLAELIGKPPGHVRLMRARNSIPPLYWDRIVQNPPPGVSISREQLEGFYRRSRKRADEGASLAEQSECSSSPFTPEHA
jgi:hypothetical protein